MKYISLNNRSLSTFITNAPLSELGGSSKYHVFDNEIVIKEKRENGKIESKRATQEYLEFMLTDTLTDEVAARVELSYSCQLAVCLANHFSVPDEVHRLEILKKLCIKNETFGSALFVKEALIRENTEQMQSRYNTPVRAKNTEKKINKSKVTQKIYSLFNLKCSQKFVAFYSVSFPDNSTDDQCFICWNYWLTKLRKYYNLENYIWVTERQKNGTLHYHMFTNNYMPILEINRAMGIIIDNQVKLDLMSWGVGKSYKKKIYDKSGTYEVESHSVPCLENYNGVDVDSIYNSKRHKKTGKILNPTELRQWIASYVTKYVSKSTDSFTHLCWHCSRSVSELFTTVLYNWNAKSKVFEFLPDLDLNNSLYTHLHSDFNDTFIFKFEPNKLIFSLMFLYNDLIFGEHVPVPYIHNHVLNYKSTTLN